jgi:hypothetical protein
MDYPFENLNDESFQEFAQSLLLHEFPDTKCFPVGQPDGGRDAIRVFNNADRSTKRHVNWIYQVKFVRDPSIPDSNQWAEDIISKELDKIKELINRGCSKYILITNARGSSHLDVGAIDKLQNLLSSKISIPIEIIWRHDLCRRLDNAWNLKWTYPCLFQGSDFLRLVFEATSQTDWERRYNAIRAFLRDQFEEDSEVRFKQIDLRTALLDLYVDVPIIPASNSSQSYRRFKIEKLAYCYEQLLAQKSASGKADIGDGEFRQDAMQSHYREGQTLDAAEFLFSSLTQKLVPALVIEGAPGQGKSTIAQYICQVYRSRFLASATNTELAYRKSNSLRLPIKIDLRDYAIWLSKKNPFDKKSSDPIPNWDRSIESFIAALIRHHSGGFYFAVDDFVSIAKYSALLLVCDGLDEVADIDLREQIVNEISRGYSRLSQNSASVQVIVTSRPAAFVNAPVLPKEHFEKLILAPLSNLHIKKYVDRWQIAKGLGSHDKAQLNNIIERRLDEPHLRELARNPMQLAILLNLMHTRGASLPDKRTALYDSYVDLFFDRESEKSEIVREYRQLLVNIHRFLAWKIHTSSEAGDSTGRVSDTQMKSWLGVYLEEKGYELSLLNKLFQGMVERVVAIVSRVEGTYEFEVQPLREYFTARFLYETAPYSPPGQERTGTKSDRFYAIARNFYWLNVTRFFAGCFSEGELLALIEKLEELTQDKEYKFLSHSRLLAFTLLSDWVFTQHPRSVSRVVEIISSDVGLRFLLAVGSKREGLSLADRCGRVELSAKALALLNDNPPKSFASELVHLLRLNVGRSDLKAPWLGMKLKNNNFNNWLEYGLRFGSLGTTPAGELENLISGNKSGDTYLKLLYAKQYDMVSGDPLIAASLIERILNRGPAERGHSRIASLYEALHVVSETGLYIGVQAGYVRSSRNDAYGLKQLQGCVDPNPEIQGTGNDSHDNVIRTLIKTLLAEINTGFGRWRSSLEPWQKITTSLNTLAPDCWTVRSLCNLAAGIRSKTEQGDGGEDLFNPQAEQCIRYRYARLRAGQSAWWQSAFKRAQTEEQKSEVLMLFFSWTSLNVISEIWRDADSLLSELPVETYSQIFNSIRIVCSGERAMEVIKADFVHSITGCSSRFWYLMAPRFRSLPMALWRREIPDWSTLGPYCCQYGHDFAMGRLQKIDEDFIINLLSSCYLAGAVDSDNYHHDYYTRRAASTLSLEKAKSILSSSHNYPTGLIIIAEECLRSAIAKQLPSISSVATTERWFSDELKY